MKSSRTDEHLRDFTKSLPMALLQSREAVMAHFRPLLRAHGITEQQWRVIRALNGSGGMEVTALANKCLILMPSLTRILGVMQNKGLLAKFPVESDHRRTMVRLTDKGRDLFLTIAPLSEAEYRKITDKIGAKNLDALYALLKDLSGKV